MVYAPIIEYNGARERVYGEIHTRDWWWETQVSRALQMASKAFREVLTV
jgi:hypothetical protein